MVFPKLKPWAEENIGMKFDKIQAAPQKEFKPLPKPIRNEHFLRAIGQNYFHISFEGLALKME